MTEWDPTLCQAHRRDGRQCGHRRMVGQRVCWMHGGKSPQALAKAEERMRELVHPAISALARLIERADQDSVSLNASKYVLDYAGFKATEKVTTDGRQVIEVEYVGHQPIVIDVPTNGHTNGKLALE